MALKQPVTNTAGVTSEYHRVAEANFDLMSRQATVWVSSYLNAEKRNEEKAKEKHNREIKEDEEMVPVDSTVISNTMHYIIVPEDAAFDLTFVYGWLKENIYTESEDC